MIWTRMKMLLEKEEALKNYVESLLRSVADRRRDWMTKQALIAIPRPYPAGGSFISLIMNGVEIGTLPDTEDERRKLAYYHIRIGSEIPRREEESVNALQQIARRIADIAVTRGLSADEELKHIGEMLGQHPYGEIALKVAKLNISLGKKFLGWDEKPEDVKLGNLKWNVIVIKGYDCPYSERYVKRIKERLTDLLRKMTIMLLEEDEGIRGLAQTYGGSPATIICDEYFTVKRIVVGDISIDRLEEEVSSV
jgi:hypothetical protein